LTCSGLEHAKCQAHARQIDQRTVFEFKFPSTAKHSKRARTGNGFTYMQFADMGEKAKHTSREDTSTKNNAATSLTSSLHNGGEIRRRKISQSSVNSLASISRGQ